MPYITVQARYYDAIQNCSSQRLWHHTEWLKPETTAPYITALARDYGTIQNGSSQILCHHTERLKPPDQAITNKGINMVMAGVYWQKEVLSCQVGLLHWTSISIIPIIHATIEWLCTIYRSHKICWQNQVPANAWTIFWLYWNGINWVSP